MEILMRPALSVLPSFTPGTGSSIPGMMVIDSRQIPWVVRQQNEAPHIMARVFLSDILLNGVMVGNRTGELERPEASEPEAGQ